MDLGGPWPSVEHLALSAYPRGGSPAVRLNQARAAQVTQSWTLRDEALAAAAVDPALRWQVEAERALDDALANRLDEAETRIAALSDAELDDVAAARLLEARARVDLWRGLAATTRRGIDELSEAAQRYRALGSREWEATARFWLGNAGYLQRGELVQAELHFRYALDTVSTTSPRRSVMLTFLADLLTVSGQLAEAESAVDEADRLADVDDLYAVAYVAWSRARLASTRGDRVATVRWIREVEHHIGEWFDITSGATFLGDAAAMLERVGDSVAAREYLQRAAARDPDDEFVRMAEAELLARSGDAEEALAALRAVTHAPWLEVVQQWRMTLLASWASMRAGHVTQAAALAADGFAEADAVGGPAVALSGEPRLTRLLAPLATRHGSASAQRLLSPVATTVHLLGRPTVVRDLETFEHPPGLPGALLRLVAVHEDGIGTEVVIDALWPGTDTSDGRRLLRTTLHRLHAKVGDVIVRDGDRLTTPDVWVDLHAFVAIADEALSARHPDLVLSALAVWTGSPLPADPYADWAEAPRRRVVSRRLHLLDLAAELLPQRAEVYLEQAIETDPDDAIRYERLAEVLRERGRPAAALRWQTRADALDSADL